MRTVAISLGLLLLVMLGTRMEAAAFSNTTSISFSQLTPNGIPGPSSPYPSSINVAGLSGTISKLTVQIMNLNHDRPDDIELLLVGPTGAKYVLMADAGGTTTPAINFTITFDDAAANFLPDSGPLASGAYKPTCVDFQNTINTDFPAPAPAGPYNTAAPRGAATLGSVFNGTNPNGTWSLYAVDDVANAGAANSVSGGWSVDITAGSVEQSTTTVTSSLNPSFTAAPDNTVTFTATVRRTNNTAVTTGTVVFKEGATVLQGATALNGSGQVTFSTSFVTEGTHLITAEYSGVSGINGSIGTLSQTVARHTTVNGSTFCNPGTIDIPGTGSPATASVYPSQIFVSGLTGSITRLSVTLSNLTHPRPDDLQLLLVGPTGARLVLMAQAGGTASGAANVTLTLDDNAPASLADAGPLTGGTNKPTSYNTSPALFPAPAPATPYNEPAPAGGGTLTSTFNGTAPNGTWSLYVIDDVPTAGQVASIGGWCLNLVTTNDTVTKTLLSSSANPALFGQTIVLTASVVNATNNSTILSGSVTFKEGSNVLASTLALNAAGKAFLTNSTLSEGVHIITAEYSGVAGAFAFSSGSITQVVDRATVVSGHSYCNPGPIVIPASGSPGTASVYPSHVVVSNFGLPVGKLSVTLSNISHPSPDDLRVLLVSPTGVGFVLMADAGGTTTPAVNVTLNFDDDGILIPSAGPLSSGLVKPSDYNIAPITFPAPAPAGPYSYGGTFGAATLASVFNGVNPNGTWSLYVIDDVPTAGQNASIANGWCLNLFGPLTAVSTITRNNASPTNTGTVAWTVSLTNQVTGVSATNFDLQLSGLSGTPVITSVTPVGALPASSWVVAASTGAGDGTLTLRMVNDTGISRSVINLPFVGPAYTLDRTAPTVAIGAPSTTLTTNGPVSFIVTYTGADLITLTPGDVILNTTLTATGAVSVTGSGATRTVTITNITGAGIMGISIKSGTAQDSVGNVAAGAGPSQTFRLCTYVTVQNTNDSGPGSLRQAITDVCPPGIIDFSNALVLSAPLTLTLSNAADSTFGPSAIRIDKVVTILGPSGSNGLTIARDAAAPSFRLFYVSPTGGLTLKNVMLKNGAAIGGAGGGGSQRGGSGGGAGGMGGAIFNQGILNLDSCTLYANQAAGGPGGGASSPGGGAGSGAGGGGMAGNGGAGGASNIGGTGGNPLGGAGGSGAGAGGLGGIGGGGGGGGSGTSPSSSGPGGIGGFGGGGGGGGAFNTLGFGGGIGGTGGNGGFGGGGGGGGAGTPDGAIGIGGFGGGNGAQGNGTGNIGSAAGGGAGMGGAIFNHGGVVAITNSTFSGNAAVRGIGGTGFGGGNGASGQGLGGALFNRNGTINIQNATFAYNAADQGGGSIFNLGDGPSLTGKVVMNNTLLAYSTNGVPEFVSTNFNSGGATSSGNNNLITLNRGFSGGIVSSADPKLGTLAQYGGPTLTHVLLARSPALDAGNSSGIAATDQRGLPRVADGDGNGLSVVDIGAVENGLLKLRVVPQTATAIQNTGFHLLLTGESNRWYATEFSTNLTTWSPILTNKYLGTELEIIDIRATNAPYRFYRLRSVP